MNDRERVLMNIAVDTAGSVHNTMKRVAGGWTLRFKFDRPAPQFIPPEAAEALGMPMKPGDIVRCRTNPNHEWGISELVEQTGYADFLLKLIGGEEILRMGNESVEVLRFMAPSRLYTGTKHKLYRWATTKAFSEEHNPHADYFIRCGGAEFDGDTLVIWSRPHAWNSEERDGDTTLYAQPRRFSLPWNEKTRLKDIVQAMVDQGFAKPFEYLPEEPTEGQAGYAKITRDDLVRVLQGTT